MTKLQQKSLLDWKFRRYCVPLTLFFKYFKGLQDTHGEKGSVYVIQKIHKISTLG